MAVVACIETPRGTGVSGKFGESFTFTRRWIVRVDSPTTSRVAISRAAGVRFGDAYPDFPSHVAMEFDLTDESGDGMAWGLTVRYYVPPFENRPNPDTGLPKDCWSAGGSGTTIPVYQDKDGNALKNTAGDPLEGAERESSEFVLTLTKCYADLSWSALAKSHANTVNDAAWNGSFARDWKCSFRSAQKKEMSVTAAPDAATSTLVYWEVTWEFHYRAEGWIYRPWDVGFNQLVASDGTPSSTGTRRAAILGADKKPVKSPVALASGVAKTPGQAPDSLTFYLYPESDFSVFGTPS